MCKGQLGMIIHHEYCGCASHASFLFMKQMAFGNVLNLSLSSEKMETMRSIREGFCRSRYNKFKSI